ncbi:MAG: LLM class flavin-dependent oxidoreductase [Nocardioidaceae bacterium]
MELGLFLNTHGVTNRDDANWWHQAMLPEEMKPVESAVLAERLGYHSVWTGDHVALPEESPESVSPVPGELSRHYPPRPNILDGAVVMGAIAASTTRIKMGPSVLIAPYRHPLSDARQFATIDFLSGGRLIMGVGAGWVKEEFEALGHGFYAERGRVLEECVQIYDRAWTEGLVTFHGRYYEFESMSIVPLPARKPRPPIIVGANTRISARLVAKYADGLMPLLTLSSTNPHQYDHLQDEIRFELERVGRDPAEVAMLGLTSFRISGADDAEAKRNPRWNLGGTAEQILSDLERYADAGYSLLVMAPTCPSRTYAEFEEQSEWLAREVLPEAKRIMPKGGWRQDL